MTATGHRFPTKCGCDLRVAYYVLHSTSRMYTVREAFLVGVSQKMPDPRARVVQACTVQMPGTRPVLQLVTPYLQ